MILEPVIHSHITDGLFDHHPLMWESVYCQICCVMVHSFNNECMQTWVEWDKYIWCGTCFGELLILSEGVLDEN